MNRNCNVLVLKNDFADIQFFFRYTVMVTSYGAKMSCSSNLLSAITESPWSQWCGIVLCTMNYLSLVEPPYAGDTYEQSRSRVMPTKTFIVFLCIYVMYVDRCAFGNFSFLVRHSVPSTVTLVVRNLALKPSGANKHTTSRSGHSDTSLHCNLRYVK